MMDRVDGAAACGMAAGHRACAAPGCAAAWPGGPGTGLARRDLGSSAPCGAPLPPVALVQANVPRLITLPPCGHSAHR